MSDAGTVAWVDGASGGRTGASTGAEARLQRRGFAVERVSIERLADELATGSPDCLVCDADECPDAVEVVRTARGADPALGVVVLAREGDESLAHRTVAAGATEYVPTAEGETLVDAVERAIERERGVSGCRQRSQTDRVDEFASVVGHDLRNPLGAVRYRVETARRTGDVDHLDEALAALDRTDELLRDLTAGAGRERPVVDAEPVSLAAVARSAWEHVATGESTLVVAEDRTVAADRGRLSQLLENLFANAAEHGPEGPTPHARRDAGEHAVERVGDGVEVRAGVDGDGCLYVEDDGRGIPPEDRDALFERGFSTGPDGAGYGLVSARRVARAHGWTVGVTESAEGGARFEFCGVDVDP